MKPLELAREINQLWIRCLRAAGKDSLPDPCPTDEDVVKIIEKHLKKTEDEHDGA